MRSVGSCNPLLLFTYSPPQTGLHVKVFVGLWASSETECWRSIEFDDKKGDEGLELFGVQEFQDMLKVSISLLRQAISIVTLPCIAMYYSPHKFRAAESISE